MEGVIQSTDEYHWKFNVPGYTPKDPNGIKLTVEVTAVKRLIVTLYQVDGRFRMREDNKKTWLKFSNKYLFKPSREKIIKIAKDLARDFILP